MPEALVRGSRFVHIINVILYFREEWICRIPPPFPLQIACLQHLQTFICLPWSSSTPCDQILSFFSIPYIYNSKTSELSSPLSLCLSSFFPLSHCSTLYFSNSITRSFSSSLPFSSLSFHHKPVLCLLYTFTNTFFSHLRLVSSGTLILSSHSSFHSHQPPPFVSSPAGSFSPQFALSSCPLCPIHPPRILEGVLSIITRAVQ